MMTKEDFLQKLETIGKPYLSSDEHRYNLKLTLMNAQKSSRIGYVLVILPCLLVFAVVIKYWVGANLGIMEAFQAMMLRIETHHLFRWFVPLVLVAAPLTGIAINLLSILHFSLDRQLQEVQITLRLRWANLVVIFLCLMIVAIFGLYIIWRAGVFT